MYKRFFSVFMFVFGRTFKVHLYDLIKVKGMFVDFHFYYSGNNNLTVL